MPSNHNHQQDTSNTPGEVLNNNHGPGTFYQANGTHINVYHCSHTTGYQGGAVEEDATSEEYHDGRAASDTRPIHCLHRGRELESYQTIIDSLSCIHQHVLSFPRNSDTAGIYSKPGAASPGVFPFAQRYSPPEFPLFTNPFDAQPQLLPLDVGLIDNTLQIAELDHFLYIYLFFSAFCAQMPIVHPATFKADGRPQVLLRAMQACGALFVKTKQATIFVNSVLETARDALVQELANNPADCSEQIDFILTVVLFQTIGLFHQKVDQRELSSIYHPTLVMMIRRSNLMSRNTAWIPPTSSETLIEDMWRKWVLHEMTKRTLLLSYLHDSYHSIYLQSYRVPDLQR